MLQILETQRRLQEARAREDELKASATRSYRGRGGSAAAGRDGASDWRRDARRRCETGGPGYHADHRHAGAQLGRCRQWRPATGQSWQSEPGARVLAPCGGTVPSPSRSRLRPVGHYRLRRRLHAVLSGHGWLAVAPGRAIRNGDLVGTMPATTKTATAGGAAKNHTAHPVFRVAQRRPSD